mgnify:CR=1 FL=1
MHSGPCGSPWSLLDRFIVALELQWRRRESDPTLGASGKIAPIRPPPELPRIWEIRAQLRNGRHDNVE